MAPPKLPSPQLIEKIIGEITDPRYRLAVALMYETGARIPPEEVVSMVNKLLGLLQYIGVAVLVGGLIYSGIQMATADTPEEQAKAKKRAAAVVLGGAILALAKPIVQWLTEMSLD